MAGKGSSPVCVGDHSMRRPLALLGIAGLAGLSTTAWSADMGPAPILRGPLPMTEAATDWNGFYVGGTWAFGNGNANRNANLIGPSVRQIVAGSAVEQSIRQQPLTTSGQNQNASMAFGAFAGYNFAVDDMVLGIEVDYYKSQITATNEGFGSGRTDDRLSGTITSYESWNATTVSRLKITDYGSVRARFGYAWGNLLPYLTAGVAVARIGYTDSATVNGVRTEIDSSTAPATRTDTAINFNPNSFTTRIGTSLQVGYALGAGIDWALSSNVFLRAELQHLRFGNVGGFDISINSAQVGAGLKF